MKNGIQLV